MGSRETLDTWQYGTVLRDNLDGDVAILISYEMEEPMRDGPPHRVWNTVTIQPNGMILGLKRDEEFILLFFQERLA